jgi:lysophospholipase L1-like esterase
MKAIDQLYNMQKTRIIGYGSSNTECCYNHAYVPGWLNWLDFGLRKIFGRFFITINSGVSGETSSQLIDRFDDDVKLFQPHLVFLTVGGNDSNPSKNISPEQFQNNLLHIINRCQNLSHCEIILQTYYCPIRDKLPADYARNFSNYMQIICQVAKESNTYIFDHLPEWQHLQQTIGITKYENELMDDPMHLSALGNQLWAYNILNRLAPKEMEKINKYFLPVLPYQKILISQA